LYTGRWLERETGDYFYRARYYGPEEGRFLSEDPIGFLSGDYNLYRYVRNQSIKLSDPLGLDFDVIAFTLKSLPLFAEILHTVRNAFNDCPKNEKDISECEEFSKTREWKKDLAAYGETKAGKGGSLYRSSDGDECAYDKNGSLIPGAGTFNYGANPDSVEHIVFDVIPWIIWD
jgi:RHS repeat-associated protein